MVNKKSWFKKNKEKTKIIVGGITSFSMIAGIIAGVIAHMINPAFGFVTLPIFIREVIAYWVKRKPSNINELKPVIHELLSEHDKNTINSFLDDVVSQCSTLNTETIHNEPIETPQITTRSINYTMDTPKSNASYEEVKHIYRNKKTGEFVAK